MVDYKTIYPEIHKILYTEEQVREKVAHLAKEISEFYSGKEILLVSVLKGGVIFLSDLIRQLEVKAELDFIAISNYEHQKSGIVRFIKDLDTDIQGKDVLIVEDIIDTGLSLNYLINNLRTRQPNSIEVCTLLDRPRRRFIDMDIRFKGFEISDVFIIGYGLDYNAYYRQLPFIAMLSPEFVYERR